VRSAYLEEKGLPEPKTPSELKSRADAAFWPQIDRADADRQERMREAVQLMQRTRQARGFERER
jgi:hypothetical protein